jgi:hypothetical protein
VSNAECYLLSVGTLSIIILCAFDPNAFKQNIAMQCPHAGTVQIVVNLSVIMLIVVVPNDVVPKHGILTEGEGSVQSTSSLR